MYIQVHTPIHPSIHIYTRKIKDLVSPSAFPLYLSPVHQSLPSPPFPTAKSPRYSLHFHFHPQSAPPFPFPFLLTSSPSPPPSFVPPPWYNFIIFSSLFSSPIHPRSAIHTNNGIKNFPIPELLKKRIKEKEKE